MSRLAAKIVDAFAIKGRGTVFIADQSELKVQIRVGDTIEFRGSDPPFCSVIKAIETMQGPPPPPIVLGIMVSSDISPEAMKRNPQVWVVSNSEQPNADQ